MKITLFRLCGLILITFCTIVSNARNVSKELTQKEIGDVIATLSQLISKEYVYPDKAKKISKLLNKNYKKGVYKDIKDAFIFGETIQKDMRTVVDDKHLFFEFSPEHVEHIRAEQKASDDSEVKHAQLREMQRFNFGFEVVKLLKGNIGYLKFNNFYDTEHASATAVAAMNFLAHADALIIDLRQNGGGSPKMIQLISSYLFPPEPVHLSGFYWRLNDQYTQNWTLPFVPGKRIPETDVYILTSANTFSAAEEFTYNLKHLRRATVVGETTGGGAHPGDFRIVNDRFSVFIPNGRSTNPITKTNWEGVGVKPHIESSAKDALAMAKIKALEDLSEKHKGASGDLYRWYLVSEEAKLNPVVIDENTLKSYEGVYGPRTLLFDNGHLYYQRAGGPKLLLNALQENLFELAVDNSFRMKLIKENDKVVALQGLFDNGFKDQFSKQP